MFGRSEPLLEQAAQSCVSKKAVGLVPTHIHLLHGIEANWGHRGPSVTRDGTPCDGFSVKERLELAPEIALSYAW
jgi:hypothetical protein